MAGNPDKAKGTWSVTMEPYLSSLLKTEPGSSPPQRPRASFFCTHANKFGNSGSRPIPFMGRYLTMAGYLTDVVLKENSHHITAFHLIVDSFEFMGIEPGASASGGMLKNTLDSGEQLHFVSLFGFQRLTVSFCARLAEYGTKAWICQIQCSKEEGDC